MIIKVPSEDSELVLSIKSAEVRSERDSLLTVTDWCSGTDVTMPPAIKSYRAALRDVPSQEGFPNTIIWPNKPEVL